MREYPKVIEEDGVKYYACPECRGRGEILTAKLYPSGHTEVWERCEVDECDNGYIHEEEFLMLKLEGKV